MCIYLMKHQPVEVAQRFAQCHVGDVVMSAVTYAELAFGVTVCADPVREGVALAELIEDIPVASFDAAAGAAYGPIRRATRESRKDHLDKLIAAHAVGLGVTLVTNNLRDFARYPGLALENWLEVDPRH
jgi:tRNA(fMet)-specific endonuclease VapC